MTEDHRYETALGAALAIIHAFDRPDLTRPAKLASVTYAVLDAIYRAEASAASALPGPGPGGLLPSPTLNGGSHERPRLPAAR